MTSGETLLKVADYPFAYTVVILAGGILGIGLTENKILLLGISGALGTFLTIVDPLGIRVRSQIKNRLKKKDLKSIFPEMKYFLHSIETRAIGIEVDKIIGMLYFVISIGLFIMAVLLSNSLMSSFIIKDNNENVILDRSYIQLILLITSLAVVLILEKIRKRKWNELDKKLEIAAMHQFSIGNEYATKTTVENMTRAIDLGDWASAEEWAQELKEEIANKKGKREVIIKSAELVFRPLHEDSVNIDISCKGILDRKSYYGIASNVWVQLKNSGIHLMIEEANLRHRIENFYSKINQYGTLASRINTDTERLIKESMSTAFGRKIKAIRYLVWDYDTSSDPNLIGCALFDLHPLDYYKKFTRLQVDIQFSDENSMNAHKENEDFDKFDKGWQTVLQAVRENTDVKKLKNLLDEIMIENNKLLKIYGERIEMQWKV